MNTIETMALDISPVLLIFLATICAVLIAAWLYHRLNRRPPMDGGIKEYDFLEIDGFRIHYMKTGRGPGVLLLHGIGANLYCWRHLWPLLSDTHTVVAVDLPGFGKSSKPNGAGYGLDDQADRLIQLVDRLHLRQVRIVGNSMGGNIALWMAKRFPEKILEAVAIAPAASPRLMPLSLKRLSFLSALSTQLVNRRTMSWAHRRTLAETVELDPVLIEETIRTYKNPEAIRSFFHAGESIRDSRLPSQLADVRSPVLLLWGRQDRLVPEHVIAEVQQCLPNVQLAVQEDGGHHLQEDHPEWVAEKILTFFHST